VSIVCCQIARRNPFTCSSFLQNYIHGHIESICSKARKTSLQEIQQCKLPNSDTILQMYLTLVRPYLEYASPVWNLSTHKQIKMLEDVEKFAMKMATRRWDTGYQNLLNMANVPSLESGRLQSSMCTLYKIVHGLCYFPPDIVSLRPSFCQRTDRQFSINLTLCSHKCLPQFICTKCYKLVEHTP